MEHNMPYSGLTWVGPYPSGELVSKAGHTI